MNTGRYFRIGTVTHGFRDRGFGSRLSAVTGVLPRRVPHPTRVLNYDRTGEMWHISLPRQLLFTRLDFKIKITSSRAAESRDGETARELRRADRRGHTTASAHDVLLLECSRAFEGHSCAP